MSHFRYFCCPNPLKLKRVYLVAWHTLEGEAEWKSRDRKRQWASHIWGRQNYQDRGCCRATQASPTDLIFTIKTVTQDNLSVRLGFILYKTFCFVSKLQTLKLSLNTFLLIFECSVSAKKITQIVSIQNQMEIGAKTAKKSAKGLLGDSTIENW